MYGIGMLEQLKPKLWNECYRIITNSDKVKCKCGKEVTYNGVTSHARACPYGWYSKSLFKELAICRAGYDSFPFDGRYTFMRFYSSKEVAEKKDKQYKALVKKKKRRGKCLVCGVIFYSKIIKTKTCSKKCAYSLMTLNRDYSSNSENLKNLHKNRKENGYVYSVWNKGLTGEDYIKHYRREGESLDQTRKRMYSGMFKKSTPEKIIEDVLRKHNITYHYSFFLGGRQFDFCLPNNRILIECDGDYWHGNTFTQKNLTESQIMKQKDDRIKDSIAKKNNNTIVRFWEYDIHNHLNEIETSILNIITGENDHEIRKEICKIEKNYTRGGGQYIRCYRAR